MSENVLAIKKGKIITFNTERCLAELKEYVDNVDEFCLSFHNSFNARQRIMNYLERFRS